MQSCFIKSVFSPRSFSDQRKCDPFLAAAGIAAGTQLVGSLLSGRANKKLVRETNAQNRAMFDEQMRQQAHQFQMSQDYQTMDWNRNRQAALEDWYRETEYNDPLKQKERYMNAGINPALAMQGQNQAIGSMESNAGGSSPSPGGMPGIPQMQAPVDTLGDTLSSLGQQYFDMRIKQEQVDQLQIENEFRAREHEQGLRNMVAEYDYKLSQKDLSDSERDFYNAQRDNALEELDFLKYTRESRAQGIREDNEVKRQTAKRLRSERKLNELAYNIQNEFGRKQALANLNLTWDQCKQIAQDIRESASRIDLNGANAKKALAEEAESIARKNGLPGQNTSAGHAALNYIRSQVYKNYQVEHFGSDFIFNPSTGELDFIPKNMNGVRRKK